MLKNTFDLKKNIVFFDIEATGLNVVKDRIVQIALIKFVSGQEEPEQLEMLLNPGPVMISEEAFQVHGISPAMVANKPTFDKAAQQLWDFIGDADLAGYNSDRYDIPMLMEEFARCGYELSLENRKTVDVQKIFYKMEPRTLSAAYKMYCDKTIENAHDALADVVATVEVLQGQITKYKDVDYMDGDGYTTPAPINNNIGSLAAFTNDARTVDVTQRLKYNKNGDIVFNFGKYIGKNAAETLVKDKQYYNWILNKDFSAQVKQIVKKLVKDHEQKNSNS